MKTFLYLEGAYIILGVIILLITLFVTTRDFMPKSALKKGLIWVFLTISFFIFLHFFVTTNRMKEVKKAFNNNDVIICESRATRKVAQSIRIQKSNQWILKNNNFKSPNYNRVFFIARCIVY
jgi:hypothetical protein